jgi:histidinol-phosphate aminotransferase
MEIACNSAVAAMEPYTPGEQPQGPGWVKLNTNEFPYPPAPAVVAALQDHGTSSARLAESLRKYPEPTCAHLKTALAQYLNQNITPDHLLIGNGSDEILRLLFHGFLEPTSTDKAPRTAAVLNPTYSLYDTIAAMFGGFVERHEALEPQGNTLPQSLIASQARIAVVANPNPPLGTFYSHSELIRLLEARPQRLTVIDEAYIPFADGPSALQLLGRFPNLAISRTMSKGMALAGARVGYLIAHPEVIQHLDSIRDSYNINALSQIAALAAVESADYYDECCTRIKASRTVAAEALSKAGLAVAPSHGNFLFARHPRAKTLLSGLRERKILVRYFNRPGLDDGIRITIGTEAETQAVINALQLLLNQRP